MKKKVCQICHKEESIYLFAETIENTTSLVSLCDRCYKNKNQSSFLLENKKQDDLINFNILDNLYACPKCSTRIEVKKITLNNTVFGCANCYKHFEDYILNIFTENEHDFSVNNECTSAYKSIVEPIRETVDIIKYNGINYELLDSLRKMKLDILYDDIASNEKKELKVTIIEDLEKNVRKALE